VWLISPQISSRLLAYLEAYSFSDTGADSFPVNYLSNKEINSRPEAGMPTLAFANKEAPSSEIRAKSPREREYVGTCALITMSVSASARMRNPALSTSSVPEHQTRQWSGDFGSMEN
jgi:hypothetical protein